MDQNSQVARVRGLTIVEAIKTAMAQQQLPMTAKEVYERIIKERLYEFHAQDPAHVVASQIRRHAEGLDFPSANAVKHFRTAGDNKYVLLNNETRSNDSYQNVTSFVHQPSADRPTVQNALVHLREVHSTYIEALRGRILADLKNLSPGGFEKFSRRLLEVYGFTDAIVTRVNSDGGIDGHGRLKVGLAHLSVSFQCKRYTKQTIQRPEIDKFRGASQGDFEQGIFFTTTQFSSGSIKASIKKGAIPIVLVDGSSIVEMMIDRRFGMETEQLPIPLYALDLVLE
jgi:restriction system protein